MSPRRRTFDFVREGLDRRRFSEADIEWMRYSGPLGARGLHKVRPRGSTKPIRVSGPRRTWKPGEIVPVGSNTGTQGRTILQANAAQRGTPFPLVTQQTQPVAPVVSPKDPLEIFGGSLVVWYDIFEQGTVEGDGNPVSTLTDFSGNSRTGSNSSVILNVDGAGGLPEWTYDGSSSRTSFTIISLGSGAEFSVYMVVSITGGADRYLCGSVAGATGRHLQWRSSSSFLRVTASGNIESTLSYTAGSMLGIGANRTAGVPPDVIFQRGATEETISAPDADEAFHIDNLMHVDFNETPGALRMFVVSNLAATAAQRSEMATYMNFLISGGWA